MNRRNCCEATPGSNLGPAAPGSGLASSSFCAGRAGEVLVGFRSDQAVQRILRVAVHRFYRKTLLFDQFVKFNVQIEGPAIRH